ncbi:MAG: arsenic resistance protein, partial [Desulfobulbaceae bacterium]|nr:arsenic resistance protein [Desulfobulbaceae bacterium]
MWNLLKKVNAQLVLAIPLTMVAGFCFGISIDPANLKILKSLIIPLTFLMVYPMMVTLNIRHLQDGIKNVRLQLLTQFINFGLIPFFAFALGRIFFADQPYLALGLLLAALLPTSGMTISWTGFAKGNIGAAINMTVIGLTLGSLATPFYVRWLMGAEIDVNLQLVFNQIIFIVFLPMLLGFISRQFLLKRCGPEDFKKTWAPRFPALSIIGVLGIVFVAMALKARTVAAQPETLLYILMVLLIIYLGNFSLSTLIGKAFFRRDDAIALVYGTVMRNLSIALAI